MKNKISALLISSILTHFSLYGQWNTSGTHIYNSNSGNVGIGTSDFTYNYKLNVAGVTAMQGVRIPSRYGFGQSESAIEFEVPTGSYNAIRGYNGTQHIGTLHFFDDTWNDPFSAGTINLTPMNAVTIGTWTAPMAYFRMSDGAVGIGTSQPNSALSVRGKLGVRADGTPSAPAETVRIEGGISSEENVVNVTNLADQDFLVRLSAAGSSTKRTIIGPSTLTRFSLGVGVSASNEHLTIVNGGKVGIGTTSPGNRLTIATGAGTPRTGSAGLQLYNGNSDADAKNWMIETPLSGAGNFNISQYQDAANGGAVPRLLILPTNSFSRSADLTIDPSGKIGIGTITPGDLLTVKRTSDGNIASFNGTSSGVTLQSNPNSVDIVGYLGGVGYKSLILRSGASGLLIDPSGNVGIGTTSPNQKLTVNGTIYGKEVKVDLNVPGPDYVFEKDYNLPSLDEIKSYVDQHKHLPEVPSAKEMEQNGINLSEMNMILLKKVEELTLFMIEQQKTNIQQTEEIIALKKLLANQH